MRGIIKPGIGIGVMFAWLLVGATPAQGLSLNYESVQAVVLGNEQTTVEADCPGRRKVIGGGAYSSAEYNQTTINDAYPFDDDDADSKPDDGWRVTIRNTTAFARNIESLAICAGRKAKVRYRSVDFVSSSLAGQVACPRGYKPTGGGVSSDGTQAQPTIVTDSSPVDGDDPDSRPDAWRGRTSNPTFTNIASRVFVACLKGEKLKYRDRTVTAPPESQTPLTKLCRATERVTGPGADTSSASMTINSIWGLNRGDPDGLPNDGARAWIDNMLTFERFPRVFAVCLA